MQHKHELKGKKKEMAEPQNSCKIIFGNNLICLQVISTPNCNLQVRNNIYGTHQILVLKNIEKLGTHG